MDGIDQSWGFSNPAQAKAAGVKIVSGYLSHDPSKNWTVAKIVAYFNVGIAILLNWESDAGRPLLGAAAGRQDALDAVAQVEALKRGVGQSPKGLTIVFSCDRDVSVGDYPQIESYYRAVEAVLHPLGYRVGVYGEASLVSHLHSLGLTDTEWQTLAWSNGVISSDADFYQYQINGSLGGASVDYDTIIHINDIGAWWPNGESPSGSGTILEDFMSELSADELRNMYNRVMATSPSGNTVLNVMTVAQAIRAALPTADENAAATTAKVVAALVKGGVLSDLNTAITKINAHTDAAVKTVTIPVTAGGEIDQAALLAAVTKAVSDAVAAKAFTGTITLKAS